MKNRLSPRVPNIGVTATVLSPATRALERAEILDNALRTLDRWQVSDETTLATTIDHLDIGKPKERGGSTGLETSPLDTFCEFPKIEWRSTRYADPNTDFLWKALVHKPSRTLKKQSRSSDKFPSKRAKKSRLDPSKNSSALDSPKKATKRRKISRKGLVRSRSFLSLALSTEELPPGRNG